MPASTPLKDRFFSKVEMIPFHECWEWIGAKRPKGHGCLLYKRGTNIMTAAHRVSYELHRGPVPRHLFVCHKCDNPSCVNPNHLFLGTNQDNVNDMLSKGRQRKGSNKPGAKLNEEKARNILELYNSKKMTQSELVRKFGVTKCVIKRIITRTGWKHI